MLFRALISGALILCTSLSLSCSRDFASSVEDVAVTPTEAPETSSSDKGGTIVGNGLLPFFNSLFNYVLYYDERLLVERLSNSIVIFRDRIHTPEDVGTLTLLHERASLLDFRARRRELEATNVFVESSEYVLAVTQPRIISGWHEKYYLVFMQRTGTLITGHERIIDGISSPVGAVMDTFEVAAQRLDEISSLPAFP